DVYKRQIMNLTCHSFPRITPHSVAEILSKRAAISERAPRIKIGDQYYHVVRIVGGRYEEAPISNQRELEKVKRIGEVYFSAHKKFAEASSDLAGKKIQYANEQGIQYEDGSFVRNDKVCVDPEDSMNYLKATDNFEWQQEVIDFEQQLDAQTPTDQFQGRVPSYLRRIKARTGNHGSYTVQQVKGFLLEYTRDKLLAAHEVFLKGDHGSERHRKDIEKTFDRQIDEIGSATQVINNRNNYFKKGYLKTNHIWQMMVAKLQPAEYRLLPEEEDLDISLDHEGSHHRASSIGLNPHSSSLSPLPQHVQHSSPLLDSSRLVRKEEDRDQSALRAESSKSKVAPSSMHLYASERVGRRSSSPIPRSVQENSYLSGVRQRRKNSKWDKTYLDSSDFRKMGSIYREIEIAAKGATSNDLFDSRERKKLYETALQKFRSDVTSTLTPKELSVIKKIIEIRNGSKVDRGGFNRLPMSERCRAVMHDLEQYTGHYAIHFSKG
ncbi:MAG: hypothetical protein P0S93_05800, partial [Candidatus Neptunochlamydia sp.]|nr:hypothetical protein [Candidatus Neptunochlamydia sp.]